MGFRDDGSVATTKLPEERGWPPIKSREDLARTLVDWRLAHKNTFVEEVEVSVAY